MNKLAYIGHEFQLFGVEEYYLIGGRGQGCKIYHIKNGLGLELYINLDRGGDIVNLTFKGVNISYLTPNGYVSSKYYDDKKDGFLKSFSGGFLTTCGLTQVGEVNVYNNKELPLHGTYSNIPCYNARHYHDEQNIYVELEILDETIFSHKLKMERKIIISLEKNEFIIKDKVINRGDQITPLQILYHINLGYPFLNENLKFNINSSKCYGRNELAQEEIALANTLLPPTKDYVERCYFHYFDQKNGKVCAYNEENNIELNIEFDIDKLPYLTEWKMMGIRDYVLGLEPGNCFPIGVKKSEEAKQLEFIKENEVKEFEVKISLDRR